MPPIPPQVVQITCPSCGTPYQTQIVTVIDVQQQPELKQALLGGQLNIAVCPSCSAATMLGTPIFYHDLEKQLALVYIPQELSLSQDQQEGWIGERTSLLMSNLPQDAPRGHLLNPRRMISLSTLVDTILEADGIPREEVEKQRRRVDLISQLASALGDDAQFAQLVEQHRDELTPEFFAIVDAFIRASAEEQQQESVAVLQALRTRLLEATGGEVGELPGDTGDPDVQQAVEALMQVPDEQLAETIAEHMDAIEYGFFQAWTNQIEALRAEGNTAEAERLTQRRTAILETVDQMNQEAQAIYESATQTLREVLQADDLRVALRERSDQISDSFLLVLSANLASAQRAGQQDVAERLEDIHRLALEVLEEGLPPEDRLINQLMQQATPQERNALLRQNMDMVTTDFVKRLNTLADEQAENNLEEQAARLRQVAREAGAMLF